MIQFYFDVHIHGVVYHALAMKNFDILRAQDDGMSKASDKELLERATSLGRTLVTNDKDFLAIAKDFQEHGEFLCGVIFSRPIQLTIKQMMDDLMLLAQAANPDELWNRVTYLPL